MCEQKEWWVLIPSPIKFTIPDDLVAIDGRVRFCTFTYFIHFMVVLSHLIQLGMCQAKIFSDIIRRHFIVEFPRRHLLASVRRR